MLTPFTTYCKSLTNFPCFVIHKASYIKHNFLVLLNGFSSGHVWMWELDYKEICVLKNWCFWTMVLEKTLESPLDRKEIQQVHPQGDQSWVFTGRTDEAETPILWPLDVKSWLIWKDPDAGKDWGQEKGMTADEVVGWHHRLNGHEFGWTLGGGDRQGSLACCSSWGRKEFTQLSDWTELNITWKYSLGPTVWEPRYSDKNFFPPRLRICKQSSSLIPIHLTGDPRTQW